MGTPVCSVFPLCGKNHIAWLGYPMFVFQELQRRLQECFQIFCEPLARESTNLHRAPRIRVGVPRPEAPLSRGWALILKL